MAFTLATYTTNDEIRSLIGVSAKELADAVLTLPHWALTSEQEVFDLDGGEGVVITQYTTVAAKAPEDRTAAETKFYNVVRLFVLYSAARQLLHSADVFSPLSISDGKASISRRDERFDKLRPAIEGGWQSLVKRVQEALVALVPTAAIPAAVVRNVAVVVPLGFDPVTGT
jgi:hypothetical protein